MESREETERRFNAAKNITHLAEITRKVIRGQLPENTSKKEDALVVAPSKEEEVAQQVRDNIQVGSTLQAHDEEKLVITPPPASNIPESGTATPDFEAELRKPMTEKERKIADLVQEYWKVPRYGMERKEREAFQQQTNTFLEKLREIGINPDIISMEKTEESIKDFSGTSHYFVKRENEIGSWLIFTDPSDGNQTMIAPLESGQLGMGYLSETVRFIFDGFQYVSIRPKATQLLRFPRGEMTEVNTDDRSTHFRFILNRKGYLTLEGVPEEGTKPEEGTPTLPAPEITPTQETAKQKATKIPDWEKAEAMVKLKEAIANAEQVLEEIRVEREALLKELAEIERAKQTEGKREGILTQEEIDSLLRYGRALETIKKIKVGDSISYLGKEYKVEELPKHVLGIYVLRSIDAPEEDPEMLEEAVLRTAFLTGEAELANLEK